MVATNPGGLGGLGGLFGEGGSGGPFLQALGLALMSSPRNAPLQNLGAILPGMLAQSRKDQDTAQERQALEMLLKQAGFPEAEARQLARNPAIAKMAMEQQRTQQGRAMLAGLEQQDPNRLASAGAPAASSPSPAMPRAAPAPLSTYNEADRAAGGVGRPSMIGQPMPALGASTPVDGQTRDLLIRTVIGEAAREPEEGQAAVAHTVLNRVNSGRFGGDIPSVLFAPRQFEPWNTRRQELMAISPESPEYRRAAQIVDGVLAGQIPDPTQGATHFQNPDIVRQRNNANGMRWFQDMVNNGSAVRIGQHVFGSPDSQPGQIAQVASAGAAPARASDAAPVAGGGNPGLAQVAQATGAMPGQPPIRNIVSPRIMPGLNAFSTAGADTWSSPTAQLAPETVVSAARDIQRPPPPPPNEVRGERTQAATARANADFGMREIIVGGQIGGDVGKALIERGKQRIDLAKEWLKPTDIQRSLAAAGIPENSAEGREILRNAIDDKRPSQIQIADQLLSSPPERANAIREVMKLGQQQVNIGQSEHGTIPPGYELVHTPDGRLMRPITGSPAERALRQEEEQKKLGSEVRQQAAQTVYEDVERSLEIVDRFGMAAAGPGALLARLPATPARTLERHIASIKGNIGIDSLLRIKESGAGLGAIPQAQLEMLASLLGSLDNSQQPEDLRYNLERIKELYGDIVRKEGGNPAERYRDRLQQYQRGSSEATDEDGWTILPNGVRIRKKAQ